MWPIFHINFVFTKNHVLRPGQDCVFNTDLFPLLFHSVEDLHYPFDIAPMLREIGIDKEAINDYKNGIVVRISDELGTLYPALRPEMGLRNKQEVKVHHLLDPEADWDRVCF